MSAAEDFVRLKKRIAEAQKDPAQMEALLADADKAFRRAQAMSELRRQVQEVQRDEGFMAPVRETVEQARPVLDRLAEQDREVPDDH